MTAYGFILVMAGISEVKEVNNKHVMIRHWKDNRNDALQRGMLKEVDRISKILRFYGNYD